MSRALAMWLRLDRDRDGRVTRLGDLRPGDDVRVVFDFDKDTPVALRIEARPHR